MQVGVLLSRRRESLKKEKINKNIEIVNKYLILGFYW